MSQGDLAREGFMELKFKGIRILLILMISVSGLLPLALYGFYVGSVATVSPSKAKEVLARGDSHSVLIDVRTPSEYTSEHLEAAQNWPYQDIETLKSSTDVPEQFKNKALFLICESGIRSAFAVKRLRTLSVQDVYNVKGGTLEWVGSPSRPCPLNLLSIQTASGQTQPLPFRQSSLFQQWMACVAAFAVKPLYMLLSIVLVVVLWRLRSPDMAALRWACIFFFIGEAFCATNYVLFSENSYLAEYLHSFGMVLAFGFTTYAMIEGLDMRVVKYSVMNEKCAALGLCGTCIKFSSVPCGVRRLFQWLAPSFVILSFIPLLAVPYSISYNTNILGTLYNYSHPVIFQIFEIRYAPVLAILFCLGATYVLWFHGGNPMPFAKILFSAAMGFFGFSMFRLILFGLYRDNQVWYIFWEEVTELLYIGVVGIALWIFRTKLFDEKSST